MASNLSVLSPGLSPSLSPPREWESVASIPAAALLADTGESVILWGEGRNSSSVCAGEDLQESTVRERGDTATLTPVRMVDSVIIHRGVGWFVIVREGGRGGYVNTEAVRRLCDTLTFGHETSREKTFNLFYMCWLWCSDITVIKYSEMVWCGLYNSI